MLTPAMNRTFSPIYQRIYCDSEKKRGQRKSGFGPSFYRKNGRPEPDLALVLAREVVLWGRLRPRRVGIARG
jgi:hypothetical protein